MQPNNKVSIRDVGVILFLERIIRHSAIRHRVKSVRGAHPCALSPQSLHAFTDIAVICGRGAPGRND